MVRIDHADAWIGSDAAASEDMSGCGDIGDHFVDRALWDAAHLARESSCHLMPDRDVARDHERTLFSRGRHALAEKSEKIATELESHLRVESLHHEQNHRGARP